MQQHERNCYTDESSGSEIKDCSDDVEVTTWRSSVRGLLRENTSETTIGTDVFTEVQQLCEWDCGIVCLQIVLESWFPSSTSREWLLEVVKTKSTWTVDLCYVLTILQQRGYKFSYIFSTQTIAVNESHQSLQYYSEQFATDSSRVQERIPLLSRCLQRSRPYPITELLEGFVQYKNCVAILLVDASILRGTVKDGSSFTGHYIILAGVDEQQQHVMVYDPGKGMSSVRSTLLERAWHSNGTDADVILIARPDR